MMTARLNIQLTASEEVIRQREEAEARQAFAVFDRDGDGLIDTDELRQTMRDLGEELSEGDLRAMMIAADTNGDGKVDFQEFLTVMRRQGKL
jgi:calmodulin